MDRFGQLASIGVLFVLVVVAAYAASRWMGARLGMRSGGRLLQAREWLPIGRDRMLVLIEAGSRLLLVGTGPQGVALVADLGEVPAGESADDATVSQRTRSWSPDSGASRSPHGPEPFGPALARAMGEPGRVSGAPDPALLRDVDLEPVLRKLRQMSTTPGNDPGADLAAPAGSVRAAAFPPGGEP